MRRTSRNPKIVSTQPLLEAAAGVAPNAARDAIRNALNSVPGLITRLQPDLANPIGEGQYAIAYDLPDGRVFKVTNDRADVVALDALQRAGKVPGLVRVDEVWQIPRTNYWVSVIEYAQPPEQNNAPLRTAAWLLHALVTTDDRDQEPLDITEMVDHVRRQQSFHSVLKSPRMAAVARKLRGAEDEQRTVEYARQLADGWLWLHENLGMGLWDITPSNVGQTADDRAVLLDFGHRSVSREHEPEVPVAANARQRYVSLPTFLSSGDAALRWASENISDFDSGSSSDDEAAALRQINEERADEYSHFAWRAFRDDGPITIYRAIAVPMRSDGAPNISFEALGTSWSRRRSGANVYNPVGHEGELVTVVLTGQISPSDIDWEFGFESFMIYGPDQWEVAALPDAPILVTHIDDDALPEPIAGNSGSEIERWGGAGDLERNSRSLPRARRVFDRNFTVLARRFPDFGELQLHHDEDAASDNGHGSKRQFGFCTTKAPFAISFAAKIEKLPEKYINGLMRHEMGHAIDFRYGKDLERRLGARLPSGRERRADAIAEAVFGAPIEYGEHLIQCIDCDGVSPRPRRLG